MPRIPLLIALGLGLSLLMVPAPRAAATAPAPTASTPLAGHGLFTWGGGTDIGAGFTVNVDWNNRPNGLIDFPVPVDTRGILAGATITQLSHQCVLANGRVACWGLSAKATDPYSTEPAWLPAGDAPAFTAISTWEGNKGGCGLAGGKAYCWGSNAGGQLGVGPVPTESDTPVPVGGALAGRSVQAIVAAGPFACALSDGQVFCWGQDGAGVLGEGMVHDAGFVQYLPTPIVVPPAMQGLTITQLAASPQNVCVLAGGKLFCWGDTGYGITGDNETGAQPTPIAVDLSALRAAPIASLVMSSKGACVLAGGNPFCWGAGPLRMAIDADENPVRRPTSVVAGQLPAGRVTQLSIGDWAVCALVDGRVYCWGLNWDGSLGLGHTEPSYYRPVPVPNDDALAGKSVLAVEMAGDAPRVLTAESDETATAPGTEQLIAPVRLLDTRIGGHTLAGQETVNLQVAGAHGIPASAGAVVATVTVTNPAQSGYLQVLPTGASASAATAVNFVGRQVRANQVIVGVGDGGQLSVVNRSYGRADVVVDVTGYIVAGQPRSAGAFQYVAPTRVLDTRRSSGAVPPGGTVAVRTSALPGFPSGAAAAAVDVQGVAGHAPGYLKIFGAPDFPGLAVANFPAGSIVGAGVRTTLDASGTFTIMNMSAAPVQIVADVYGVYRGGFAVAAGSFVGVPLDRVLDTRMSGSSVAGGSTLGVDLRQSPAAPAALPQAAVVTVTTVAGATARGYTTIFGSGPRPKVSTLNFAPGAVVGNQADVPLDAQLYNGSSGPVDDIVDEIGYLLR